MRHRLPLLFLIGSCACANADPRLTPGADGEYFHPRTVRYAPYSERGWQISVRRDPLAVELRAGPLHHVIPVPDRVEQLRDVRVADGKLIVIGWMSPLRVTDVAIYSLRDESLVDEFWGYAAAPSLDAARIAFIEFYPPHGVSDVTDIVRVYTLADDRSANRFDAEGRPGSAPSDRIRVGRRVFPPGSDLDGNVDIADKAAYGVMSYLTWDDSGQLMFVTRNDRRIELQRIGAQGPVRTTSLGQQCRNDLEPIGGCIPSDDFFRLTERGGAIGLSDDQRALKPQTLPP